MKRLDLPYYEGLLLAAQYRGATPRGTFLVSTPEATALDVVGYACGVEPLARWERRSGRMMISAWIR